MEKTERFHVKLTLARPHRGKKNINRRCKRSHWKNPILCCFRCVRKDVLPWTRYQGPGASRNDTIIFTSSNTLLYAILAYNENFAVPALFLDNKQKFIEPVPGPSRHWIRRKWFHKQYCLPHAILQCARWLQGQWDGILPAYKQLYQLPSDKSVSCLRFLLELSEAVWC